METKLDSLSEYITMAKKIISKFAPGFYSGLRKELLSNEDAIADIASAIMVGDGIRIELDLMVNLKLSILIEINAEYGLLKLIYQINTKSRTFIILSII